MTTTLDAPNRGALMDQACGDTHQAPACGRPAAPTQSALATLALLQRALTDLQAGRLDQAEVISDQVKALPEASPWVRSAVQWLQDEIRYSRPAAAPRPAPQVLSVGSPLGVAEAAQIVADDFALTERELAVCELVARGFSRSQIAATLFVSISTVAFHLSNSLAKTGTTNRHELSALLWQYTRRCA